MTREEFWSKTESGDYRTLYFDEIAVGGIVTSYDWEGFDTTAFHFAWGDNAGPYMYDSVRMIA